MDGKADQQRNAIPKGPTKSRREGSGAKPRIRSSPLNRTGSLKAALHSLVQCWLLQGCYEGKAAYHRAQLLKQLAYWYPLGFEEVDHGSIRRPEMDPAERAAAESIQAAADELGSQRDDVGCSVRDDRQLEFFADDLDDPSW